MIRFVLALAVLAFAAPALAWTSEPGGGSPVLYLTPQTRVAYEVFTATGSSLIPAHSCTGVKVHVLPSIAAAATGTPSVKVWDCAAGTTALDTAGKRRCTYVPTIAGGALDGNEATSTESVYSTAPAVLGVEVTSHPGGSPAQQVAVEARCQ